MREVFISTPSILVEANFNASAMRFGSDDTGRHDIQVVNLAGMDGYDERSIFISHEESGRLCSLSMKSLLPPPPPHLPRQRHATVVLMASLLMYGGSPHSCTRMIERRQGIGHGQ